MGRLIDGVWTSHDLGPDAKGRFVRRAAKFRGRVTADGQSGYPATAGRYHLYVADACGWCHRTLLFRQFKGLQEAVTVSRVVPFMGEHGWTFAAGGDPVLAKEKLHEVYTAHDPGYTGRVTVPILWDRETATIVTNESMDITRDFDRAFAGFPGVNPTQLFDPERAAEIDRMIELNYHAVNNGVYRAGFAGSQAAYDEAIEQLFGRLEQLEVHLARRRYLLGDTPTAADLYLLPTLVRFDSIYYIHFKCCVKQLRDFPNLWGYTRDLYQAVGASNTYNVAATRSHYFASHESIHPRRIVPKGPDIDFDAPHTRAELGGGCS